MFVRWPATIAESKERRREPAGMEDEDPALLAAARAGDAKAFEALVGRHADAVWRVLAGHLGPDAAEVEDAAQEVFVRMHQGLRGFAGDSRLSTWVFRIATNVALTRAKRVRVRRGRTAPIEAAGEPAARGPSPDERAAGEERRDAVRRAIEALPEKERAVAVLRGLEEMPFEEIARVLGIQRPTAESRMARAKERLRSLLKGWL